MARQSKSPADATSANGKHDPIASLRYPGYLLYLIGSLLSNAGNQMRIVAVGWEIYQRTHAPMSLGLIGLALAVPVLVLALPAGALADRHSRRAIIMLGQAGLAISGAGLAWASFTDAHIGWIYFFLLWSGISRAVGWPAATAIVPGLVPPKDFANAAMWRSAAYQIASTVGPLVGGFMLAVWNPWLVYLADAASSIVLIGCLFAIHPTPQERSAEPASWRSLIEGIRFLRHQPIIVSTMTLDMVAVLFGGVTALLPIYATDILHVGATGFGWLRAMPSIGSIVMGLVLAVRPPFRRGGHALLWAVVIFGVATIVFGLSRSFPLSLAALFTLGAADNISVIIRATVLQLLTPDSMRGRVSAVAIIFIGTSNEVGEFESGLSAQWIGSLLSNPALGTIYSVVGGGVMTLVTVAAVIAIWPQLTQLGALEHLEPPETPESMEAVA